VCIKSRNNERKSDEHLKESIGTIQNGLYAVSSLHSWGVLNLQKKIASAFCSEELLDFTMRFLWLAAWDSNKTL
jgi:hypothetical protein